MPTNRIVWPQGKAFAFSIFDDPDSQTLEAGRAVYGMLAGLGFRTTKGVWPAAPVREPSDYGVTCGDPAYVCWLQELQTAGFEIGLHNVTSHTSMRPETERGLDRFAECFGGSPRTMAGHYFCKENLYWGDRRVTGVNRLIYNAVTLGRNRNISCGHEPGHPCFWGDICRRRIKYVRNFVFPGINTLTACPEAPYHDPARPYVNYWFASSEGANVRSFSARVSEANQDRLEEEGGACIMYAHFGHGFQDGGTIDGRFQGLMKRLACKNGWFVPVSELLDYLLARKIAMFLGREDLTGKLARIAAAPEGKGQGTYLASILAPTGAPEAKSVAEIAEAAGAGLEATDARLKAARPHELSERERGRLEAKWLRHKMRFGRA